MPCYEILQKLGIVYRIYEESYEFAHLTYDKRALEKEKQRSDTFGNLFDNYIKYENI